jgi:hypothetical protein
MNTQLAIFIASVLSIIPSFGLLTLATWWYERKLDEKDLNITYIIGIFIGVLVVVAHLFFAVMYNFGKYAIPAAFLLALLEVLIYRVYLDRTKLKGRSDQPFIAFSFALGISGAYLLFITGQFLVNAEISVESALGIVLFTLGVPLTRSSVALIFSSDRAAGRTLFRSMVKPALILSLFNLLMLIYMASAFVIVFSLLGAIVGISAFAYSFKRLSEVPEMKRDASADDSGA